MDNHPTLQQHLQQSTLHSTAQSSLVTASLLLFLAWLAAWLFDLGPPLARDTLLAIAILTLGAVALRLAWCNTMRRATTATSDNGAADTSGRRVATYAVDTRRSDISAVHGKHWSLDVFASIDAQRFADVCETWFSWAGFDTRHECHRTPEGIDIWLRTPRQAGPVAIVRCKHVQDKPVGLQDLRDFLVVVSTCKDAHGTFTTTSTYTPQALQFAKDNGIEVVDGRGLLHRIMTRTRRSQQALLAVAYHGL